MVECNGVVNPYNPRQGLKGCNAQELNDVVKNLRANGNRLTGEDGGRVIDILSNNLKTLQDLGSDGECGLINHGMGQLCYLFLSVYVWGDYKLKTLQDLGSDGECGLINHGMGQLCYLFLSVYVWGDYKFVCQCQISYNYDDETNPIYYGTVDLYNNGDPR